MRKLVEITLNYPFDQGETFCEDELKIAEKEFDEIILISLSGHKKNTDRYMPSNARLLVSRPKRFETMLLLKALFKMFSPDVIKEYIFANKQLGYKKEKKNIGREIFIYVYYMQVLKKVFRKEQFDEDCIFYSYWMSSPAFFLSWWKKKHPKITAVTRAHRYDCFIECAYQPFRREILKNLDCIYSISDAGKRSICNNLVPLSNGCSSNKIKVSRLGIIKHSDCMNAPSKDKTVDLFIVTCSNVLEIKRLDLLIDALEGLDFDIHWVHFGNGNLYQIIGNYAKEKLKKKKNIRYDFQGWMPKEDILKYYSSHPIDIFVNCSDSEGIPVSIMEAMAYGIPVIARNVGGNNEIVDSTNGILLPERCSCGELADAIRKIKELKEEDFISLRTGAYEKYFKEFRAENNYKTFFDDLKSLRTKVEDVI